MSVGLKNRLRLAVQEKKRQSIYHNAPERCQGQIAFVTENKEAIIKKLFDQINQYDVIHHDLDTNIEFFRDRLQIDLDEYRHELRDKNFYLYVYDDDFSELLTIPFGCFEHEFTYFWALGLGGHHSIMAGSKFILVAADFRFGFAFFKMEHDFELITWPPLANKMA